MKIENRIVVIAGGSSGIGLGTAHALAERGAGRIVLLARQQSKLDAAAAAVHRQHGTAVSVFSADLGSATAVQEVAAQIIGDIGPPDILVNSTGAGLLLGMSQADDDNIVTHIESTCYAGFFLTRAFLGPMIARNRGHIVFVGSPAVNISFAAAGYIASRSAVRGLAQSLRYELSQCDVNVTYAEPSLVYDSEYFDTYSGSLQKFPLLVRSPRFRFMQQNSAEAGRMIARAIERNRRYTGHWLSYSLRLTPFLKPFYDWFFRVTSLPASQGGPHFPKSR